MTLEADFMNDPVGFMTENAVRTVGGLSSKVVYLKFSEDTTMKARKSEYHWYNKKIKFYKLENVGVNNALGAIKAYWLGYKDNSVEGSVLGIGAMDPAYMFTVTMNSCTFGRAQANNASSAYVTHHNARLGNNDPLVIQAQNPVFSDNATPGLSYHHRPTYMSDSSNALNFAYRGTTFGVRSGTGEWKFYIQNRKKHGEGKDNNVSLKGVVALNP